MTPTCLSGTESFGLFSCLVNGEEREQTHRAVFRYSLSLIIRDPSLSVDTMGHWGTQPDSPVHPLTFHLCPDLRFIPRHPDELELDVDDPVLVEAEGDDLWSRGFNMRTGERGVFPAFYAHAVPGPAKDLLGEAPCPGPSCHPRRSPLDSAPYAPREQARPLLGGAFRRAVPGLRGGALSPGQWYPVCSHAEGQSGGEGP